jgi:uncharacterized protein YecE (DUF72 family)
MLVEFRHKAWFEEPAEPLAFLEEHGMTYVTVDAPPDVIPLVVARTSGRRTSRFHGRNRATWFKRTGSTAERFDYLYPRPQLEEWAGTLHELEEDAGRRTRCSTTTAARAAPRCPRELAAAARGRTGTDERGDAEGDPRLRRTEAARMRGLREPFPPLRSVQRPASS